MHVTIRRFLGVALLSSACLFAADDPAKLENDSVKVHTATDMPHQKGAPHRHPLNRVMIYLDAGDLEVIPEGGQKTVQHWKADDVAFSVAAGTHTSENVGKAPLRIVEIELKNPGPAAQPKRNPKLDLVATDPKHTKLLFENDQVRVFRSWREAGGVEPMHEHMGAGRVTVLLTDTDASMKTSDGTVTKMQGVRGQAMWSGPMTHTATNLGKARVNMVIVEVK